MPPNPTTAPRDLKLHILSDLHLEFGDMDLPSVDADLTVFAGDIHTSRRGFEWIRQRAPRDRPVLYVLGNHEFYRDAHPQLVSEIEEAARGTNIHVLENDYAEIDGYLFYGCTLWAALDLFGDPRQGAMAALNMNDYLRITCSDTGKPLSPRDTRSEHLRAVRDLKDFLSSSDRERAVVVTHHAPSPKSLPDYRRDDPLSAAYASRLDSLIERFAPTLWIHGHIHTSQDYRIGRTRVVANPRGYVGQQENLAFDPELVVEI